MASENAHKAEVLGSYFSAVGYTLKKTESCMILDLLLLMQHSHN